MTYLVALIVWIWGNIPAKAAHLSLTFELSLFVFFFLPAIKVVIERVQLFLFGGFRPTFTVEFKRGHGQFYDPIFSHLFVFRRRATTITQVTHAFNR